MKKNLLLTIIFYLLYIPLYLIGEKVNSLLYVEEFPHFFTTPFVLLGICSVIIAFIFLSKWIKYDTKYSKYAFLPIIIAVLIGIIFVTIIIRYSGDLWKFSMFRSS